MNPHLYAFIDVGLRWRARRYFRNAKGRAVKAFLARVPPPPPPPPLHGWLEVSSAAGRPWSVSLPVRSVEFVEGRLRLTGLAAPGVLPSGTYAGPIRYALKGTDGSIVRQPSKEWPMATFTLMGSDSFSMTVNLDGLDRLGDESMRDWSYGE